MPLDWSSLAVGPESIGVATLLALATGAWLGWILENRAFAGRRVVSGILTAAIALPAPLLCYYLLAELGHRWTLTPCGLTLAAVLSVFPALLRSSRSAFAKLGPSYGQAARTLGVPEWSVFARIELPLVWKPLLRAGGFAYLRLLLELVAAFWIAEART